MLGSSLRITEKNESKHLGLKYVLKRVMRTPSSFLWWVIIVSTMNAFGVLMTTKVLHYLYDLGVKGQGQLYVKSVIRLLTHLFLYFVEGADDNIGFRSPL